MSPNDPVVVYLDLNHWYALGAALAGRPEQPDHVAILKRLEEEVTQGQLVFPLSSVHYMELAENSREHLRREAAAAMRLLSRFVTIASIREIVDEELARELNRRFGLPAFPKKAAKFGVGAGFAFGQEIRLKPFEGLPKAQLPALEARLGITAQQFEQAVNELFEYELLTTPSATGGQIPGYDRYAARREADRELVSFNVMLKTLRTDPEIARRPLEAICARQFFYDIEDNYVQARIDAGLIQSNPMRTAEELTDFLMHLPSRRVASMMQFHYLKDIDRDWTINDLRDIHALSMAIPYCDVVVTDKKAWDVTANRAKLGEELNKAIFCRLVDLAAHLGL